MRISDWSSAVCSSDLLDIAATLGVEGLNLDLHSLALLPFCSFRRHSRFSRDIHGSLIAICSLPQARRVRCISVARNLHCVLNQQPGPLRTGNASLYKEQAALGIRTDDFQILLRALPIPHVTSHLLVLEDATGILAITRRAVGTVRNGYAVGGAHTPETPTLHRTSKALTLRMTGDVDQLPCDEMVSRKLSSDVQQRVISDSTEAHRVGQK